MPVDTPHPAYSSMLPIWVKVRDTIDGEEAVKDKGTDYLPALDGHEDLPFQGHKMQAQGHQRYRAYKMRASYFEAPQRTRDGLVGAIMRKEPSFSFPDAYDDLLESIGRDGATWEEMQFEALEEVIGPGRLGQLVDSAGPESAPFVVHYFAENITNWEEDTINGRRVPVRIHLREELEVPDPEDPDGFEKATETQYRLLHLGVPTPRLADEEDRAAFARMTPDEQLQVVGLDSADLQNGPIYFQEIWRKSTEKDEWFVSDLIVPRMSGGRVLNRIPFEVINPDGLGLVPSKPIALGITNLSLSYYRNSADLEHGRHFTAIPQPWGAGFDFKTEDIWWGSEKAWISKSPDAKIGVASYDGKGLDHLLDGMKEKKREMAVLGARLLEEQPKGVEAAETVKLRQAGESSVLARVSIYVSMGLTKTLQTLVEWATPAEGAAEGVEVQLNKDFGLDQMSPQMVASMVAAMQARGISWSTVFWNMKRGELIPDGISEDDERARIAAGIPEVEDAESEPSPDPGPAAEPDVDNPQAAPEPAAAGA